MNYSGKIIVSFGSSILDVCHFNSQQGYEKMLAYFEENRKWCLITTEFESKPQTENFLTVKSKV